MPTIKIDGREIPFEEGETIITAAHRAGIDIPHYCWHPGLSAPANCRMCLVEIEPPPGRAPMMLDILRFDEGKSEYIDAQKPKLQPACQVPCADGMVIKSDTSEHVREARAAVQELLLLNHPVDCPICDQAGECRLQDYWLEHQRTGKRMRQEVVHKPKAVVFGPTIVYDAERCILCTRCIRVCRELAKDPVLSMRERGNMKEITLSSDRQLDHNYSLMTEHVCPVGSLTSSHFRFKARVWFLRTVRTICQGCATGCNAYLDYDPRDNTPYRYRPRDNMAVNQHWMCDEGMLSYPLAVINRLEHAHVGGEDASIDEAMKSAQEQLRGHEEQTDRIAFILSARHSLEDNFALVTLARQYIKAAAPSGREEDRSDFFLARLPDGPGDGVLMCEDKNSNVAGCEQLVAPEQLRPMSELVKALELEQYSYVIGLGSDIDVDPQEAKVLLQQTSGFVLLCSYEGTMTKAAHIALPVCCWAEAAGTYVNRQGLAQTTEAILRPRGDARPAWELIARLARSLGYAMDWKTPRDLTAAMATWSKTAPKTEAPKTAEAQP
jgi:NADH-quinone oxidoreductase subunit G